MLEWTFRAYPSTPEPAEGEVWLVSGDVTDTERRLAAIAVEVGIEGFLCGPGEPRVLVLPDDPTLDDMLAASILESRLAGQTFTEGWKPIVEYAALVRKGLRAGKLPVEDSLEGIYLALRNAERSHALTDAKYGARFHQRWRRLWQTVVKAASQGKSPLGECLFDAASEYAEERAYLVRDIQLYRREVVERWHVRFPTGEEGRAVVLAEPKSLLFKHWARELDDAVFLVVNGGTGRWIFSTDPVQRISLEVLAEVLQEAELQAHAEASADPWYDGERFGYSLVASPRSGSRLPDPEVLRRVRKYLNARVESKPSQKPVWPLVAALCLCVALVGGLVSQLLSGHPGTPGEDPLSRGREPRGRPLRDREVQQVRVEGVQVPGYALIIAVSRAPEPKVEDAALGPLKAACADARRMYELLVGRYNFQPENIIILADDPTVLEGITVAGAPDREQVSRAIDRLATMTRAVDRSNFLFYYAGHGHKIEAADAIGYLVLQGFQKPYDLHGYDMGHLSADIRRKISSTHKLLLVDCCFSGFTTMQARGTKLSDGEIFALWKNKAHVILTAGTSEQLAWERGDQSEFTRCLLRALGSNGTLPLADGYASGGQEAAVEDGIVTDEELFKYLHHEVPRLGGSRRVQTPQYYRDERENGDDLGQFLFIPTDR